MATKTLYSFVQCIVSWYHQSSAKLVQNNTRNKVNREKASFLNDQK